MLERARTEITTDRAIEIFLRGTGRRRVLSMAEAVRKVRVLVPECELQDQELAELIARHAMGRGVAAVAFDLTARRRPMELAVQ